MDNLIITFRKHFIPEPAWFTFWDPLKKTYKKTRHQYRMITDSEIQLHMKGKQGLTVSQFIDAEKVKFGAIDIDIDDFEMVKKICDQLIQHGIQPNIFKSKSKGYHIYVFPEGPISAEQMIYNLERAIEEGIEDEG